MRDDNTDPDLVKIRALAHQLHEHFDSVQIIATKDTAEQSRVAQYGAGSLFARAGATRAWLTGIEAYLASEESADDET